MHLLGQDIWGRRSHAKAQNFRIDRSHLNLAPLWGIISRILRRPLLAHQAEMRKPQVGQFSLCGDAFAPQPGHCCRLGWDCRVTSVESLFRVPKYRFETRIPTIATRMMTSSGPIPKIIIRILLSQHKICEMKCTVRNHVDTRNPQTGQYACDKASCDPHPGHFLSCGCDRLSPSPVLDC